jgi:hypothetical protein
MKSAGESLRFEILKSQLICRALSILGSTSLKKTLEFITQTVSYSARDFHSAPQSPGGPQPTHRSSGYDRDRRAVRDLIQPQAKKSR